MNNNDYATTVLSTAASYRRQKQQVSMLLAQFNLQFLEWCVLEAISELQDPTMSEVSREVGIDLPLMSRNVDKLVEKNFIEVYAQELDKRYKRIKLTPTAQLLIKGIREQINASQPANLDE